MRITATSDTRPRRAWVGRQRSRPSCQSHLLPEEDLTDLLVVQDVEAVPRQDDRAVDEHRSVVSHLERGFGLLLDEQDRLTELCEQAHLGLEDHLREPLRTAHLEVPGTYWLAAAVVVGARDSRWACGPPSVRRGSPPP